MSLLTRLHATEAQQSHEVAGTQAANTLEAKKNVDPRTKMMKEIQAMLDGYPACPANGSGAPGSDEHDNLSLKLKHDFCTWGGMLYATSIDNLESACRNLMQRVEAIAAEEQRIADEMAASHENFAYSLGASLVQQEKSGVLTGEATTLDDAAIAFEEQLKDAAREIDVLWAEWSRS